MVIFENKGFQTNSMFPDTDWTGKAKFVLDDSSELANKIRTLYPYYEFVLDNDGNLIDVEEVEHEEVEETELETEPTELEKLRADVDYLLLLSEV